MNTFKKYIIGLSATLVLVLTLSGVALAHGGNDTSSFSMGNNSMMDSPMWNDDMRENHSDFENCPMWQ